MHQTDSTNLFESYWSVWFFFFHFFFWNTFGLVLIKEKVKQFKIWTEPLFDSILIFLKSTKTKLYWLYAFHLLIYLFYTRLSILNYLDALLNTRRFICILCLCKVVVNKLFALWDFILFDLINFLCSEKINISIKLKCVRCMDVRR